MCNNQEVGGVCEGCGNICEELAGIDIGEFPLMLCAECVEDAATGEPLTDY